MKNQVFVKTDHIVIAIDRLQGQLHALIDHEDYERLRLLNLRWQARWSASARTFYVQARLSYEPSKFVQIHRLIMGVEDKDWRKIVVDHGDHNGLNNRRRNLTVRSKSDNHAQLLGPTSRNTSGFRGVTFDKRRNLWQAQHQITVDGKRKCNFLGYFSDPVVASKAVDEFVKSRLTVSP